MLQQSVPASGLSLPFTMEGGSGNFPLKNVVGIPLSQFHCSTGNYVFIPFLP